MNIGVLNKKITIQSKTSTTDNLGGYNDVWSDLVTVFAAIWPVSASDVVANNTTTMIISHRVRIRYRNGIMSNMRIKFGARYFAIVSIINVNEANKQLDLMCKEAQ